jgi:hypothetical protein
MSQFLRQFTVARLFLVAAGLFAQSASAAPDNPYYPPAGEWAHKKPAEVGMDAAKLAEAVSFMMSHETNRARDFSDQEIMFGKLLGSVPTQRAATNGIIIRHGYIVGEFGDTMRPDPTYSVAKSMLSTVAGLALQRGLIPSLDDAVANAIKDGGYETPHNRLVTGEITFSRNRSGKVSCGERTQTLSVKRHSEMAR